MHTADFAITSIVVTGIANGAVKAFDQRIRDTGAVVRTYREHASWLVGAADVWRTGSLLTRELLHGLSHGI
ncbi:hypothetical protein BU17DRAFT_92852 [Hysterangium stoloniferum]|nr:hypothetical protein BU17DRAFT_92852 [Hysterangium stoloniferum]